MQDVPYGNGPEKVYSGLPEKGVSADKELELVDVLQRYSCTASYSKKRIFGDMELNSYLVVESLVEAA